MNAIKRIVLGVLLGLFVAVLAAPVQASYCELPGGPFGCYLYAPSPPAGWTSCASGYTPASGEVAIFDGTNYTGHCAKRAGNFDQASLGDFDSTWHISSMRTRATWYVQIWDGINYTSSTGSLAPGDYSPPASFSVSSMKARNF